MGDFPTTPSALFRERNNVSETEINDFTRQLQQRRWYDAMVTDVSADNYANRYLVNIHAQGLSTQFTHAQIPALNLEPLNLFLKGWPCQVIYDGRLCVMRRYPGNVAFIPDAEPGDDEKNDFPHRIPGWIGDPLNGSFYSIDNATQNVVAQDFRVFFTWKHQYLDRPLGPSDPNTVTYIDTKPGSTPFDWATRDRYQMGLMWARPTIIADRAVDVTTTLNKYVSSGIVLTAGDPLPQPTKKYQVLTPIDDTLTPIWTEARFTDDS